MWFDQAKIHTTYDDDALLASRMNVNPGGAQPKMRTSPMIFHGRPQAMTFPDGTPKGLKVVLEERGVNVSKMKKEDTVDTLNEFEDFKNENEMWNVYWCVLNTKSSSSLNFIQN